MNLSLCLDHSSIHSSEWTTVGQRFLELSASELANHVCSPGRRRGVAGTPVFDSILAAKIRRNVVNGKKTKETEPV